MTFNFLVGGRSASHDIAEAAGVFIQENYLRYWVMKKLGDLDGVPATNTTTRRSERLRISSD